MNKDIIGQELRVGDVVAFNQPHLKGIILGIINKFSLKTVGVKFKSWDGVNIHYVYANQLIKIPEGEASIWYQRNATWINENVNS